MKTEKELNELKEEVKEINKKLAELTKEELVQVTGGSHNGIFASPRYMIHIPSGEISPTNTIGWFGTNEPREK